MTDRILSETEEESSDLKYELYRALKTFCVIMIIFCFGFIFNYNYAKLIENSRFIRFYPTSTLYYQDFSDGKDFDILELSPEHGSLSYGIFKDEKENDKFLLVTETKENDTPISPTDNYFYFVKNKILFLSDSETELLNLQQRLKTSNIGFLNKKNVKRAVRNLDKNRDYTLIIDDMKYSEIDLISGANEALNKIFDKIILQGFKNEKGIKFSGEVIFDNDIAGIAMNAKKIREYFSYRNTKILDFRTNKIALILAVKDFDLWAQTLVSLSKTLPDNQYSETLKFIELLFNTDVESDIVKKLNGNGAFYLFSEKKDFHPLLVIDTKQDIAGQVRKYLGFLQITNSMKLSEKEVNKKQLNILTSKFSPYNIGYATINDNLFLLGHQNIIENLMENKVNSTLKECDFYFYSDISKLPIFDKGNSIICDYKTFEIELTFNNNISFEGTLNK